MTDLFLLSRAQMRRIEGYFPLSHGVPRVDDRRIVSAIVFVIKKSSVKNFEPRCFVGVCAARQVFAFARMSAR